MYIRINTAKIKASKEEAFVASVNTQEVHTAMKAGKGFLGGYLLQSSEDPQVFLSCTLWETPKDSQAFFTSPDYRATLVGVAEMIESPPVGQVYAARVEYTA